MAYLRQMAIQMVIQMIQWYSTTIDSTDQTIAWNGIAANNNLLVSFVELNICHGCEFHSINRDAFAASTSATTNLVQKHNTPHTQFVDQVSAAAISIRRCV